MKHRRLSWLLCAVLLCGAAACSHGEERPPENSTPSVSVVENTPAPSPSPVPSSGGEESPSPQPTPEGSGETETNPEASVPEEDFDRLFAENPIYAKLNQDLAAATSNTLVEQAYDTAAGLWRQVIAAAYEESQQVCPAEEAAAIQQEQQAWEADLDGEIDAIREDYDGDSLLAAPVIVEHYRQRAEDLCRAVYHAAGEMPAFPDVDGEGVG